MAAYVFTNVGLPIFNATGAFITFYSTGQSVDHSVNMVTTTTADVLPNYGASSPRATPKPSMPK